MDWTSDLGLELTEEYRKGSYWWDPTDFGY
jgi:hypothetical protein